MVRTWEESEHPRDEEGRFTFKNGVGSTKKEDYFQGNNIQLFDTKDYINGKRRLGAIGLGFISNPKIVTGGAAEIVTDNIVGVQKGEPMSIDDALKGTNPNYSSFGNLTYRTNCQAGVAIFEARLRGFDIEPNVSYLSDIKDELSMKPNIAYIDPVTGKIPEFTILKSKNEFDCISYLDYEVRKGERYLFAFKENRKSYDGESTGHIITVLRDKNNELKFYDPQINKIYNCEILSRIKYKFDWGEELSPPMILRVDDKELNKKVFNQISKPSKKLNNN